MNRLITRFQVWLWLRRMRRRYGQERLDQWAEAMVEVGRRLAAGTPTCEQAATRLYSAFSYLRD